MGLGSVSISEQQTQRYKNILARVGANKVFYRLTFWSGNLLYNKTLVTKIDQPRFRHFQNITSFHAYYIPIPKVWISSIMLYMFDNLEVSRKIVQIAAKPSKWNVSNFYTDPLRVGSRLRVATSLNKPLNVPTILVKLN